jgi:cyclohexadieny/prephenate dehydrogenase
MGWPRHPQVAPVVHFVLGHPVAGTEHSGPESGFAELFAGRWCILIPLPETASDAITGVTRMWERAGMRVVTMSADHHDKVLAVTLHLPHLIAYTIVGTATDLEDSLKSEVIEFSATGFRDFTRIAASDPVMWHDIFLNNREAALEILQRFNDELTALQRNPLGRRRQIAGALHPHTRDPPLDHRGKAGLSRRPVVDARGRCETASIDTHSRPRHNFLPLSVGALTSVIRLD